MKPRHQRMIFIAAVVIGGAAVAGTFVYKAIQENVLSYQSPTQVLDGEAPADRRFRLGGLVVDGSVKRAPGSLTVDFLVTDLDNTIPVEYTGVLPDLFSEGKGVVTHGRLADDGHFVADEVVAKHDENYMSPEVAASLAKNDQQGAK